MTKTTEINWNGVDLEVNYNYSQAEKTVYHCGDGSGYEGCNESVEIECIKKDGIPRLNLSDKFKTEIQNIILEEINAYKYEM